MKCPDCFRILPMFDGILLLSIGKIVPVRHLLSYEPDMFSLTESLLMFLLITKTLPTSAYNLFVISRIVES